jgi:hypothetical protein
MRNTKLKEDVGLMNIKKLAVFAAMSSLSSVILFYAGLSYGDTLILDDQSVCDNIATVYWQDGQLTVTCDGSGTPVNQPTNPTPSEPTPSEPTPSEPTPSEPRVNASCPDSEPNTRVERFSGRGIDQEFVLGNTSILAVPFMSGKDGAVKKIALGEPGKGEHFKKTVIISTCPGVYNPDEYDFTSSVEVCALTGLELSFSVIAGTSRSDYPLSSYRCVLKPNEQYYINVFQRYAGSRPPFEANTKNTCNTNECGVRVSIR